MTIEEACTGVCITEATAAGTVSCRTNPCLASCTAYEPEAPEAETAALYLAMMTCLAETLTAADFVCADTAAQNAWSPVENTACDDEVCAWTCNENVVVQDYTVYGWCGC
jgi:hypothetical protein